MRKLFIPYTEALEMKELGFNEKCLAAYTNRGKFHQTSSDYWDNDSIKMIKEYTTIKLKVLAPLYPQAFKWFRDNYNLSGDIISQHKNMYFTTILNLNTNKKQDVRNKKNYSFKSYEEAELECIRKLIEIVKEQKK